MNMPAEPSAGPGAYGPPPVMPQQPQAKKMSAGAKWAIGITIGVVVLIMGSCVLTGILFSSDGSSSLGYQDSVAVIYIDDAIAGTGAYVTPESVLDQLDQALDDPSVAAIVLRIDSPGGTVAASQEISMAVKRANMVKPVVASIGDMGASGAYMVASQCESIVAAPGSSVGSIGVIMTIPNVEGLLDTVGVEFTVLTTGEFKDTGSMYRSVTPTEAAMLEGQMEIAYNQFIADVAAGRGMAEDDVRELATGWVWLGTEAQELGLVDELGNYDDAIALAADLGGIEGDPYIVNYEYYDPFSGLIGSILGVVAESQSLDADAIERLGLMK